MMRYGRRLALLLALSFLTFGILSSSAQDKDRGTDTGAAAGVRVSPLDLDILRFERRAKEALAPAPLFTPKVRQDNASYSVWHIEFDSDRAREQFQVGGAFVFWQHGPFADVFVKADNKVEEAVQHAAGVKWADIEPDMLVTPPPRGEFVAKTSKQPPDTIARGGVTLPGGERVTGKGVIIAIVDTGIDFRHPDFIRLDAQGQPTSRLLYFWDATRNPYVGEKLREKAPVQYPNGVPIGTVYTQKELTDELRSPVRHIPVGDSIGHGTGCASIAAGNNPQSGPALDKDHKPVGVAPDADLIAVRVATGMGISHGYLLAAICDWIDAMARREAKKGGQEDMPAVVSCSFGGHMGGHDGSLVEEHELDALFTGKQGRALCIAAGNEGQDAFHADAVFEGKNHAGHLKWTMPQGLTKLALYFNSKQADDVQVQGKEMVPTRQGTIEVRDSPVIKYVHGSTRRVVAEVLLAGGTGELSLSTVSGEKARVDAYLPTASWPYGFDTGSQSGGARFSNQVGEPSTAACAIAVGSYDWNDNFHQDGAPGTLHVERVADDRKSAVRQPMVIRNLSAYSNRGFVRGRDVAKPEVVAPGQWFVAAIPQNLEAFDARDSSGLYQAFNGTSAATPYTAGVVALLMEKKKMLTSEEIKDLIKTHASPPHAEGKDDRPSIDWGWGKLDAKAVEKMLTALH
jgi:subtilisin family serine protease